MKGAYPSIAALVTSGDVRPESTAEATAAGASHFLAKPFEPDDLAALVDQLLESSSQAIGAIAATRGPHGR